MKRLQLAQHLPAPMLPTLVDRPFSSPEWLFETKWDGVRAICAITRKDVYAVSRTGRDLASQFPELANLRGAFKNLPLIIDGEIVSLDAKGHSSFQRLQPRINRLRGATDVRIAVSFAVFDILMIGADDVRQEPLERRKALLKKCMRAGRKDVFVSRHITRDGIKAFSKARRQGLEGIVAKRLDSSYRSGRSRNWLKIKVVASLEFVICGWTEPRRSRKHFGALLLGIFHRGKLTYAGHVGTGFDERTLAALHQKLERLETKRSPFSAVPKVNSPVHWAKPKLVAEIKFGEWTREGVLRQPVYLGLRVDKRPKDCVRPPLRRN
ncbi:MAG TPA: non-homologous end-joining DNA ligase [Candidatus Eremiobacteraceae bacterium]